MPTLKRYKSHRIVSAGKILAINKVENEIFEYEVSLESDCEDPVVVAISQAFFDKHGPYVGGYYITYDDGYASFCPGLQFEKGYDVQTPSTIDSTVDIARDLAKSLRSSMKLINSLMDLKATSIAWQSDFEEILKELESGVLIVVKNEEP